MLLFFNSAADQLQLRFVSMCLGWIQFDEVLLFPGLYGGTKAKTCLIFIVKVLGSKTMNPKCRQFDI